jgi:FkbM family methyltransferase
VSIKDYINKNNINFENLFSSSANCDLKILYFLKNIENGFFIEAGAHDGLFQSNTKILEDLNWNGILIEPSKILFERCKLNRKVFIENYALTSLSYEYSTINGFVNEIPIKDGIILMGLKEEICQTTTITEICKKYKQTKIDFFSLDTEGYEIEILKGIDFDLIDINYFLIELNSKYYTYEELISFMNLKNFDLICNLSNFTKQNTPTWPENHQDYLFQNKKYK